MEQYDTERRIGFKITNFDFDWPVHRIKEEHDEIAKFNNMERVDLPC